MSVLKFPIDLKWCLQASPFIFDRIFVKLAGNQDSHKISDEFEFQPDRISHFGVTCPCGRIKFSIDILRCLHLFSVVFEPILFILAGNEAMHKILGEFDFRPDWTIDHRLIMEKWCLQASSFIFDLIFVKLAGNQDSHKFSDEFEFRLDRISHFGVRAHKGRIKFSIDIIWNLQVQLTFQTLEFFVTLFSGTVKPRRLKLGTYVGSGQMYHVYWNQAASAYSSLYFFIFLSLQFSTLKILVILFSGTVKPRRLKLGTVDSGQMYHVYRNQAAAAYSPLYFFVFLSLQCSTLKFHHSFLRNCEA